MNRLVAIHLDAVALRRLRWATKRSPGTRRKSAWVLRIQGGDFGRLSSVPGWEDAMLQTYAQACKAIQFILDGGGTYDDYKQECSARSKKHSQAKGDMRPGESIEE